MFKKSKLILATALAATLCAASALPAFALDENGAVNGTASQPAQASITKILTSPIGTAIPMGGFQFKLKPISVDGEDYDNTNMPIMCEEDYAYYDSDSIRCGLVNVDIDTSGMDSNTSIYNSGDTVVARAESGNFLANADWTHTGVYTYQITECPGDTDTHGGHDFWTYSGAMYTLTLYVQQDTDGNYYVASLTDVTDGMDSWTDEPHGKIDPTPGAANSSGAGYSQMIFNNSYVHTNGAGDSTTPDLTDDNSATLTVTNAVDGDFADYNMYFDYSLTLAVPNMVESYQSVSYNAYIIDTDGSVVSDPAGQNGVDAAYVGTDGNGKTCITFNNDNGNISGDFKLKDGQKLVFVNTPVGTGYTVTNLGDPNYYAYVTINGGYTSNVDPFALNMGATTDGVGDTYMLNSFGANYIMEGSNIADFVNVRDMVSPTGLKISDLPFMGLIALALASLVVFVAVKSRKKKAYNR